MISLIVTVLNEGGSIQRLMESISAQTRRPDEIVIVDGGSADDTVAILQGYRDRLPLRLLIAPGCNISQGRNRAIQAARGDIIAVTDAGVRLDENWLAAITAPLLDDADLGAVAGFFHADPQTRFELALAAATLPLRREIDPASFLPSSRSIAFRKSAALAIGLYPEWLDYGEDLVFDLRLARRGGGFAFAPAAIVHFRPRQSPAQFFRQYYLYARGDGKADLWRRRHAIRYATYFLLAPSIALLGLLAGPHWWLLFLLGGALYLHQPYRRLPTLMRGSRMQAPMTWLYCLLAIALIRPLGDAAKMLGYPQGWRWRLRQRRPDWRA